VLDSRGDFRPKLQQLGELLVAEIQMIMLTATLPPSEEGEFLRRKMMPPEVVTTFRAPTTRQNVRYQVVEADGRGVEADEQVVRLMKQKLAQYPTGKIIVYVASISRVKRVAERLECKAYYPDVDDKSQVFERIVGSTCRVVVATNALGLGLTYRTFERSSIWTHRASYEISHRRVAEPVEMGM